MIHFNSTIKKNVLDIVYIKAYIDEKITSLYLPFLFNALGNEKYKEYVENQQQRDNYTHHMTIINPIEYPKIQKSLDCLTGYPLSITTFGIGYIREPENATYFLVCQCHEVNNLRCYLDLPPSDLHVTLGFEKMDIFDKPKDKNSLLPPFSILEV